MILAFLALLCGILLALTWVGYPLAMWISGRRKPALAKSYTEPLRRASDHTISVILATRESPERTVAKVSNLFGTAGDASFQVIVAVDRAGPHALAEYVELLGPAVTVVLGDAPGGKAAALNAAVRSARGGILVMCDCAQRFDPGAIDHLISRLRDRRVGAVSGLIVQQSGSRVLDAFWRLNVNILRGQAALHSIVSVSGAIYAIRADLWRDLPPGLICDDLFVTLSTVASGHRVGFCSQARAIDDRYFTAPQQFNRKVRTVTGLLQFCRLAPWALDPFRNPIWTHFVLQKLLRFATPFVVVLGAGCLIALSPPQVLVPLVAVGGAMLLTLLLLARIGPERLRVPADSLLWALALQAVPVTAAANAMAGRWDVWKAQPEVMHPARAD